MKAPRSGVDGSATRLDRPGYCLPWAQLSVPRNASECKRRGGAVARRGLVGGCACSRGVSSRSCRRIPRPGIAAWSATRQRGVGVAGAPAGRIAPAITVKRGVVSSLGSIASGCARGGQSAMLSGGVCRQSRARASAQHSIPKNLAAPGLAATSASCAATALRCRSAAGGCADRLYGACGSVKRAGVGGWKSGCALLMPPHRLHGEVPSAERPLLQTQRPNLYCLAA
jgi:hypothetical protein